MIFEGDFSYKGCLFFQPIADYTGISIDKFNFLISQLCAIIFGNIFQTFASPSKVSTNIRHLVEIFVGILLIIFCFGSQVIHVFIQSCLCLLAMKILPPGPMEKTVFVVAMGYLCLSHIYRMIYDYAGYTLDISGCLMMSTQRLTSLAYNIADGCQTNEKIMSKSMQQYQVKNVPDLLEFCSYIFSYHGIICGPFCFYVDYLAFIEGSDVYATDASKVHLIESSRRTAVKRKLLETLITGFMFFAFVDKFPVQYLLVLEFKESSFLYKVVYIIISTTLMRQRYYFAWKLAELVNLSSGLGYHGFDNNNEPLWDHIYNVDIIKLETATSMKVIFDSWNVMTSRWLRYVVYDRWHSTIAVFTFSAFWHGFYAGYYLTFINGAIFVEIGRMVRKILRPYFQSSYYLSRLYDLLTFAAVHVTLSYLVFPFVLLEATAAINVYRDIYFWLHALTIPFVLFLLLLAHLKPSQPPDKSD